MTLNSLATTEKPLRRPQSQKNSNMRTQSLTRSIVLTSGSAGLSFLTLRWTRMHSAWMMNRGSTRLYTGAIVLLLIRRSYTQDQDCINGTVEWMSDGYCDPVNNHLNCSYDGGDCCRCDCVDGPNWACIYSNFFCVDPASECFNAPAAEYPDCDGDISFFGNGVCSPEINNEECGYDGGDCCQCGCTNDTDSSCGNNNNICVDPMSDCVGPLVAEYPNCGHLSLFGDGNCDSYNNHEECGYDGGDCCPCDCVAGTYSCGNDGFFCVDVNSKCIDPIASAYPNCSENLDYLGDGYCDKDINIEECGYDGGDCCECDCVDGGDYSCGDNYGFSCVNPGSDCFDTSSEIYPSCGWYLGAIGDGKCDLYNNNEGCGFDGGDCCECDCSDGPDHTCGSSEFFCANPTSECIDPIVKEFPDCYYSWLLYLSGGGTCEAYINNENCGYDGGDCCDCTCVGTGCLSNDTYCVDPNGGGLEVHNCMEAPASVLPCSDEHPDEWVVQTAAQAFKLAEAANCSNGIFNVKWMGGVIVNKTIFVVDGTVMNIKGVGTEAIIDGAGHTRLFTVLSSELNIINVTLSNGSAVSGGAVAAADATLRFDETVFLGNSATGKGGALLVSNFSTVFFGKTTAMINNTAGDGGAIFILSGSSSFWTGITTFTGNTAISGGGAVYLAENSIASWAGSTMFSGNTVELVRGGALCMWDNSNATWSGNTTFSQNFAPNGGAVSAWAGSRVAWMGVVNFYSNQATYGGAVELRQSDISCLRADTVFLSNAAELDGGAVLLTDASRASWDTLSGTAFTGNTANDGGALAVATGSSVEWSGRTNFTANSASLDGGAVGSNSDTAPVGTYDGESRVVIRGPTRFTNNTCSANGGGMAMTGNISVLFQTTSVAFSGNFAGVGGGAVYISSTGESPFFNETSFALNSAPVGGAVYASASRMQDPTSFYGCTFVGNAADITGGAVDSVSGEINVLNSSFRGNIASVGGALRLVGTTSVVNCEFIENASVVGGGPAVSKIGQAAGVNNSVFRANMFSCESGMILDISEVGDLYGTVCSGCGTCYDCEVEDPTAIPTDCISLSDAGVQHATSNQGIVEKLDIARGYWRATNKSREVLECFNQDACKGGIASKTSDYCVDGFKGPYCSICEDGYTKGVGFTCVRCTSKRKAISTAVIAALGVLGMTAGVAVIFYLLSGEMVGSGRGFIDNIARHLPMQSVKIIIVAWQILAQVQSVTQATYPGIYEPFLNLVDLITFNFTRPLLTGCFFRADFHDHLLIAVASPIFLFGLLAMTHAVGVWRHQGSDEALRNVRHKHVSMVLLITFLVYSRVSSTVFQTFACEGLDTDDPLKDKQYYLMADYSIECDHHHKKYQILAGFMVVLYPVGIPAAYALLLFQYRNVLQDGSSRDTNPGVQATSSLWESYKPSRFYYEIVECARRVLLTSVLLLIKGETSAQIAVTIMLAFFFAVAFEISAPYKSYLDTWVSRLGNAVIFTSMYLSLLIKVDVSDEAEDSQNVFGTVLVAVHVCMMLIVAFESVSVSYTLRVKRNGENRRPKMRSWSSDVDNER